MLTKNIDNFFLLVCFSEVLVINHPEVTSPVTEYGSCDTISNSDRWVY